MIDKVSFGKLYIGSPDNKEQQERSKNAIINFVDGDKKTFKQLSEFFELVDKETGSDIFIFNANNTSLKLNAKVPHKTRNNAEKHSDLMQNIYGNFWKGTNSNQRGIIIELFTNKFKKDQKTGYGFLLKLCDKYNSENDSPISIPSSKGRLKNLEHLISEDNNVARELSAMLEKLSKYLKEREIKADLICSSTTYKLPDGVNLSLKTPSDNYSTTIYDSDNSKEKCIKLKELGKSVVENPPISKKEEYGTKKEPIPELNTLIDKYC